jgi:3',5'-cyclic AMP phosphodiesterase CpdA
MSKILLFTDIHITPPGKTIIGLDPAARFAEGLAHAARMHPDADRMIVMGDLTHFGSTAEYARLKPLLEGLPWPVTLMIGNHDRRRRFRAAFPDAPTDPDGFIQTVIDLPEARLITLDSVDETGKPEHSGYICPIRMDWLSAALDGAKGQPCLIFIHHPAFDTDFTGMDRIGLRNAQELRAVLKGSTTAHVFAGHIHRTITASIDGMAMTVIKSPCHQMPMMLAVDGSGHSVDEPGAYGIILLRGQDVVVHFEDFTLPGTPVSTYDDS